jgi:3-hydroxyisobutyrate dehydrogenase-like beta-hydroxyacid dehydrogenase
MALAHNPDTNAAANSAPDDPHLNNEPIRRVALIGFGEAGGILACDLAARGLEVSAFDILFDARAHREAMFAKVRDARVRPAQSLQDCVCGLAECTPQLVISAVTASSAADVARDAALHLRPGQLYLDINSVSPETKRRMGARISPSAAAADVSTNASRASSSPPTDNDVGAPSKSSSASPAAHSVSSAEPSRSATLANVAASHVRSAASLSSSSPLHALFIEAAVMAAVPPQRLKVPMLLGGPYAAEAAPRLRALGLNATALSDRYGIASAVKMCRSVLIKGLEALALESMLAARRYGAEDEVLASLAATYPGMGWQESLPDYLISRVAEHGRRRAAEVREVAQALREVGVEPVMAAAIAERQDSLVDEMAARGLAFDKHHEFSWRALADALASLTPAPKP